MKSKLIILVALLLCFGSFAQHKEIDKHTEYGFMLGGTNYTGDLSPGFQVTSLKPSGQLFYRHNYNDQVSVFRINLLMGKIGADEASIDSPLPQDRQYAFNATIMEASLLYEYDFFNFRDFSNVYYMSPYLVGGLGMTMSFGGKAYVSVPFGTGIKLQAGKQLNVNFEFMAHKLFSDSLDGYSDDPSISSSVNNDWYYSIGIGLTRTVYNQICREH
jgi:hypothetical protein